MDDYGEIGTRKTSVRSTKEEEKHVILYSFDLLSSRCRSLLVLKVAMLHGFAFLNLILSTTQRRATTSHWGQNPFESSYEPFPNSHIRRITAQVFLQKRPKHL